MPACSSPAAVHGNSLSLHFVAQMSRTILTLSSRVQMDNQLPQPSTQPFAATHSTASQPSSTSHTPQHSQTAQPPVQIPFSDPFHTRDPFMPSSTQHSRRDSYSIGPATPAMGTPYERAWSTQPQPPGMNTRRKRVSQGCWPCWHDRSQLESQGSSSTRSHTRPCCRSHREAQTLIKMVKIF